MARILNVLHGAQLSMSIFFVHLHVVLFLVSVAHIITHDDKRISGREYPVRYIPLQVSALCVYTYACLI